MNLEKYISAKRFAKYIKMANGDNDKANELYADNNIYAGNLQILLSNLEVILRNAIDKEMGKINSDWILTFDIDKIDPLLANYKKVVSEKKFNDLNNFFAIHKKKLDNAKVTLKKENKAITNDYIISKLTFGFWTTLFCKEYGIIIWNTRLGILFKGKTRHEIKSIIEEFRELRNRIAHNECIINQKYTPKEYANRIIDFIRLLVNEEKVIDYIKKQCRIALF